MSRLTEITLEDLVTINEGGIVQCDLKLTLDYGNMVKFVSLVLDDATTQTVFVIASGPLKSNLFKIEQRDL